MPEGDTIHKDAAALRPLLVGRELVGVRTRGGREHPALAGRRVVSVEPHGKHLFITLDDDSVVRVHLRMRGRWHRYAPGEAWQGPPSQAMLVLETADSVLVCFGAIEVEWTSRQRLRRSERLQRLGPDLLAASVDWEEVARRAMERSALPLEELLLDQTVAAGIGNVYKSELLFLERLWPWTAAGALEGERLEGLFRRARDLMLPNLARSSRITTAPAGARVAVPGQPRLWVYDRVGRPCLRCKAAIACDKRGVQARVTYWCPQCQPEPEQGGAGTP